jgi:hypothetical protein
MKRTNLSGRGSPERKEDLRFLWIKRVRRKKLGKCRRFFSRAEKQHGTDLERADLLDQEEARDIMKAYLKGCFSALYRLSGLRREGHYFVGQLRNRDGHLAAQLFLDKQSGHIISVPDLYLKEIEKTCARNF